MLEKSLLVFTLISLSGCATLDTAISAYNKPTPFNRNDPVGRFFNDAGFVSYDTTIQPLYSLNIPTLQFTLNGVYIGVTFYSK